MIRLASVPAVALAVGVALAPLVFLLRVSLYESGGDRGFYAPGTVTFDHYAALVHAPVAFTVGFALAVAIASTLLGLGLALFLDSLTPRCQLLAGGMLLAPKLAGALTAAFGLQRLLPHGTLTALLAEVTFVLPYAVLAIFLRLRAIPADLLPAARGLGASSWQSFRRVTLPLVAPGVVLAFQLSLAWGLGAFVGPLLLAGPAQATLGTQIHAHVAELRWPVAAAEGVLLLALTAAAFAVTRTRGRE